jgi:hypothetical protein
MKIDIGPPQVEDIIANINAGKGSKAKRRVNTHGRMKRSQDQAGKIIEEVFKETFHQTPGSGSYSTFNKGKMDPKEAAAFTADVRVKNMKYMVEVKSGYEHVLIEEFFVSDGVRGGKKSKNEIRKWIEEVNGYSRLSNLPAIILWKKPRRRFVVIVNEKEFTKFTEYWERVPPRIYFDGWVFFDVAHLLALPKDLLFETGDIPIPIYNPYIPGPGRNTMMVLKTEELENVQLEDLLVGDEHRGQKKFKKSFRELTSKIKDYDICVVEITKAISICIFRSDNYNFLFGHYEKKPACLMFEGWCIMDVWYLDQVPKKVEFS